MDWFARFWRLSCPLQLVASSDSNKNWLRRGWSQSTFKLGIRFAHPDRGDEHRIRVPSLVESSFNCYRC